MTVLTGESRTWVQADSLTYQEQAKVLIGNFLPKLDRFLRRHILMHILFLMLLLIESSLFLTLLPTLVASYLVGMALSLFIVSFFAYILWSVYARARKLENLERMLDLYVKSCREVVGFLPGTMEHHIAVANFCWNLASKLEGRAESYYSPPNFLRFFSPYLEYLSFYLHWEDLDSLREELLQAAAEEHVELVKHHPTNLSFHRALANAYVVLSQHYAAPLQQELNEERWIPRKIHPSRREQFRMMAARAIEEFKILCGFVPDDPWVHGQLAYSYQELQMPIEAIREYEILLKMVPTDPDILFKLGRLYFQQGENAKGLRIYEKMRQYAPQRAEALITYYGCSLKNI